VLVHVVEAERVAEWIWKGEEAGAADAMVKSGAYLDVLQGP
jgi:hypothetical protein